MDLKPLKLLEEDIWDNLDSRAISDIRYQLKIIRIVGLISDNLDTSAISDIISQLKIVRDSKDSCDNIE